ncbi:hypothetical protein [Vibrio hepatarius]|uniref:hypothetical protein n=1 Tax=Vibrio hepatarius TaxID=171383 RepID=UPI001C0A52CB|nr:hypothetical protein [Vibrio hepatarius]MBU2897703.1 hypothetical protein [Vibrio hepatarius]
MRPETLLAKFGLKGINYSQGGGGKGIFSLEEQLAMVGISWKESPVGFLILFTEIHKDFHSRKMLEPVVMLELINMTAKNRGQKSELAYKAIVQVAITEATSQLGQICPTCNGSGYYKTERRQKRNCTFCNEGRIQWDEHSRFAALVSDGKFRCTYSVFKRKYLPILQQLTCWLSDQRTIAMLALMERIKREEEAA